MVFFSFHLLASRSGCSYSNQIKIGNSSIKLIIAQKLLEQNKIKTTSYSFFVLIIYNKAKERLFTNYVLKCVGV
jgi:hypothetical protein